jgi:hypothetical protein
MELRFEPLVDLGIGFIQIESVKSVVKNQGFGLVAVPPRQVIRDCIEQVCVQLVAGSL